jgi:hypothetical protein
MKTVPGITTTLDKRNENGNVKRKSLKMRLF